MENLADLVVSLKADFGDAVRQVGDLQSDIKDLGEAAVSVANQMSLFGDAVDQIPFADAAGQLNLFATELEPIGPAMETAAGAGEDLAPAIHEVGEESEGAAGQIKELGKELMELAGIALTLEALKEMAEEAVHVYAETERVQFALGYMSKDAAAAAEEIEKLKDTAQEFGLSFETVEQTAQRMTAAGASINGVRLALQGAANASAVTGYSFERTSAAIERMTTIGTLNGRMLLSLKITTQEVADAMGVSLSEVTNTFKNMNVEERLAVLSTALEKFGGAGEQVANLTEGQLQRLKNAWTFAMEDLGKALAPIVTSAIPALIAGIKGLVATFEAFIVGSELIKDSLVGTFRAGVIGVEGFGKAIAQALTKDYAGAVVTAVQTNAQLEENGKKTWAAMLKDTTDGLAVIDDLFKKRESGGEASEIKIPVRKASYEEQKAALDAETKHNEAMLAMDREAYESQAKLEGTSLGEQQAMLIAYDAMAYEIKANAIQKELDLEKSAKAEQKNLALSGELQAAKDKQAAEDQKLRERVTAERAAEIKKQIADELAADEHIETSKQQLVANVEKLLDEMDVDQAKALQDQIKGQMAHDSALLETQRAVGAAEVSAHQMTVFEKLALDKMLDDDEAALQKQALAREIANLEARRTIGKDYAAEIQTLRNQMQSKEDQTARRDALLAVQEQTEAWKVLGATSGEALRTQISEVNQAIERLMAEGAPMAALSEGVQRRLELEIKLREQEGMSASAQIVALQNEKLATDALVQGTHGLADIYVGLTKGFQQAFNSFGNALTQSVMQTKHLGDAMVAAGKEIATSIIGTVVGGAMQALEAAIVRLLVKWGILHTTETAANKLLIASNTALSASYGAVGAAGAAAFVSISAAAATAAAVLKGIVGAQNSLLVFSWEAVFDAATMAAYAGIPFAGPGIAAAQIAGAAPVFAGLGITAAFAKEGFDVGNKEVLTMLHPREMVLPEDLAQGVRNATAQGGAAFPGSTASGLYNDFRGATFGAGLTQGAVDTMMNSAFSRLRLAGMKPVLT